MFMRIFIFAKIIIGILLSVVSSFSLIVFAFNVGLSPFSKAVLSGYDHFRKELFGWLSPLPDWMIPDWPEQFTLFMVGILVMSARVQAIFPDLAEAKMGRKDTPEFVLKFSEYAAEIIGPFILIFIVLGIPYFRYLACGLYLLLVVGRTIRPYTVSSHFYDELEKQHGQAYRLSVWKRDWIFSIVYSAVILGTVLAMFQNVIYAF